jgi:hypothetical protein
MVKMREQSGTLWGRPETGRVSSYLLSGLARCGLCGASMVAAKGSGAGRKYALYACSYNSNRGKTVCANTWRESQEVLDGKVIGAIERTILTPDAVSRVVERALQLAKERRKQEPDTTKKVEAEIKRLTRERDNLVAACAQGKAPESVLLEIHNREQGIESLKDELARSPHPMQVKDGELEKLKQAIIGRMGRFQELVYADVPLARQALRKLLAGPIKCTPVVRDGRRGCAIRGEAKLENLLPGASVTLVPRKGLEPPQCCHR